MRSIVGPELDLKMGYPHSEPLPEDEVVVGLTYPNILRIQMTYVRCPDYILLYIKRALHYENACEHIEKKSWGLKLHRVSINLEPGPYIII